MKLFIKPNKLILVAAFLIFAVQPITNTISVMALTSGSTDQTNGSDFSDDPSVGTRSWANPINAQTSDDIYTYFVSLSSPEPDNWQQSHYLSTRGFGFNIPDDATITGIVAKVERKTNAASVKDADIHLIKDGNILTSATAATPDTGLVACPTSIDGDCWVTDETIVTYGGSSDLWGEAWTPTDINSPNFGLAFSAQRMNGSNSITPDDDGQQKRIYIDNINITVYYTTSDEPPVINSHADVYATATSISGVTVDYTSPNTTDNTDGVTLANCSPISGSLFTIGTTEVTCTKTNSKGASAIPTHFNVIITDGTIPTVISNDDNRPQTIAAGGSDADANATVDNNSDDYTPTPISETNITSRTPATTTVLKTNDNIAKTDDVKKTTNIFRLTLLGVYDWLWFILLVIAGVILWRIIVDHRRKDNRNKRS